MNKYTVVVRIKVKGSKSIVTGRSAYDSKSYDKKFKNAVMNAVYIDADNRHKKIRYDTKYDYELKNSSIAYVGREPCKAKKGVNRRLHNEILIENSKRIEKAHKEKQDNKRLDKSISKKQYNNELYGDKKMKTTKKSIKNDKKLSKPSNNYRLLQKLQVLENENRLLKQKLKSKK